MSATPHAPESARIAVRRHPERGVYDRAAVHGIIDEALICHLGIVQDGQPFVMPIIHVRMEERLYFHGSHASRLLRAIAAGQPACATFTHLDGLVLARTGFNHSMNYRSAVALGSGGEVIEFEEKVRVLDALIEHVVPGRVADLPKPTKSEIDATMVVWLAIEEASAKVRQGPSLDPPPGNAAPIWTGVLPLAVVAGAAEPDAHLPQGLAVPHYVARIHDLGIRRCRR
jgi:nitroimidazol reductase NimA-like FMN-containing flavoprotein (pyridoxamine 5'-phosphate oxidase superfamily)